MTEPTLNPDLNPHGFDISQLPNRTVEYLNKHNIKIETLDNCNNVNWTFGGTAKCFGTTKCFGSRKIEDREI